MDFLSQKNRIRSEKRQLLAQLTEAQRERAKEAVQDRLSDFLYKRTALNIAAFSAMRDEINLDFLWEDFSEKQLFLPRYRIKSQDYDFAQVKSLEKETNTGKFGIREAKQGLAFLSKSEKALCLIPGLAFDRLGGRLGRGHGFYDRLLKDRKTVNVAVCYDFQICDFVPKENWDISMDYLITEKQIIKCNETG